MRSRLILHHWQASLARTMWLRYSTGASPTPRRCLIRHWQPSGRARFACRAWRRPASALLRVEDPTKKAQTAVVRLNLAGLGVKVSKLWREFYLPLNLSTFAEDPGFDAPAETWTVKLNPGEVRLLMIDTY